MSFIDENNMEDTDSTLDKDAEIIGKLSKEIKILKKTIKQFRKNKTYSLDIKKAEKELYRLKDNLSYHRLDKKYKFLNMMMAAPLPNFRIDYITETWYYEYSHLPRSR
jgi:hypothetical protein